MSKQRSKRESKALKHLMRFKRATALDIGTAAVEGEKQLNWKARAHIGLSIGVHFVKRGIARATRHNQFEWVPPTK